MSGCSDCISTAKAREEALDTLKLKAKMYALENNTNVFLYFDSDGTPKMIKEESARLAGIQPTAGIVTPYQSKK